MAADLRFDDQTVVIIGATRPIAEVLVQFFEPRGANIAIQDISIDPASRMPDALGSSDNVLVSRGGIDHSGSFVAAVAQKFGAVHVLINVADLVLHDEAPFAQTDGVQWNCLMNVRQKSLFKVEQNPTGDKSLEASG
jgi:NADP-dependent 3-hydroxy acid dehydrogenase YdfG